MSKPIFQSNRKPMQVGNLVQIKSGVRRVSETIWIVTSVTMVNGAGFNGKVDVCRIEPVTIKDYKINARMIYGYELNIISEGVKNEER